MTIESSMINEFLGKRKKQDPVLSYSEFEMLEIVRVTTEKAIAHTVPLSAIRHTFANIHERKISWVCVKQDMRTFSKLHLVHWQRAGPGDDGDVGITPQGLELLKSNSEMLEP